MQIRPRGEACPARVDHDELPAPLLRLLNVRHQMNSGDRGVHSPEDDKFRFRVVLQSDAGHLSVKPLGRRSGRRRADRPRQPRRAQPREEPRVDSVVREVAVGSPVAKGKDALSLAAVDELLHPARD